MEGLVSLKNIPVLVFSAFGLIFLWYAFSIVYHFIRFGVGRKPKILALVYFMGSFFLFGTMMLLYNQVDWSIIAGFVKISGF